jgi:hypothetical protein
VVADQKCIPPDVHSETDFRAIKVCGPLDFSEVGILAGLTLILRDEGISTFAISTFDTDYLLVRSSDLEKTKLAFEFAGHTILS